MRTAASANPAELRRRWHGGDSVSWSWSSGPSAGLAPGPSGPAPSPTFSPDYTYSAYPGHTGPSQSYQLFSERELPDEATYYNQPVSGYASQSRVTPLRRVHQQATAGWPHDPYLHVPLLQQQQQQQPQEQPQQQQLYWDGYGYDYQLHQQYNSYSDPLASTYDHQMQQQQQPQHLKPLVYSAGQYGFLDDDFEDVPPYKSILATLEGDQFDSAVSYGALPDPHHEPRPYGLDSALPAQPALSSLPLASYPALPAADSMLSSPFGKFVPSSAAFDAAPAEERSEATPAETTSKEGAVQTAPDGLPVSDTKEEKQSEPQAESLTDAHVKPQVDAPVDTQVDAVLPTFEEIQGLPTPTEPTSGQKPLAEDPTEDDEALDEENQSDSIPDIFVAEEEPVTTSDSATMPPEADGDAATTDGGQGTEGEEDGDGDGSESISDRPTTLVIKPVAKAEAGEDGVAIAMPVSKAVVRGDHPVIVDYDPEVSAVAGANGMAHAMGELILTYVNATTTAAPAMASSTASASSSAKPSKVVAAKPSPGKKQ